MYERTQFGTVIAVTVGGMALLFLVIPILIPKAKLLWVMSGIMGLVFLLFYQLKITVSETHVTATFGIGLIRKQIQIADITSCTRVRNSWVYGIGIRYLGRRSWLYNVTGLDAVEFVLSDGRHIRFGSPEPDALVTAVDNIRSNS